MIQTPIYWFVLAACVAAFWAIPRPFRMGFLALASFGYLLSLEPVGVVVLAGWALLFYLLAPKAAAEGSAWRWVTPGLILAILGYLAYFKYAPPLVAAASGEAAPHDLVIPLGISYFTFKLIHYAIETGRGNIKDRSPQTFCCYIFLFPIFTAGPIERLDHFIANREQSVSIQSLAQGTTRIFQGLIKKLVIGDMVLANGFGDLTTWQVGHDSAVTTPAVWLYVTTVYLTTYMDFSAYSDIAIGASRLFGLRIMENFNWPILAPNISDFWKRWHMSLVNWCMAYIYMPALGLRRNPYIAAYATFIVIAFWHAASWNWIVWGLYNATGLIVFQTWLRYRKRRGWKFFDRPLGRCAAVATTFLFVTCGYPFVMGNDSVYTSCRVLAKMLFLSPPA